MRVPYIDPSKQHAPLEAEILTRIRKVLRHGQFVMGPEVEELESSLAKKLGVRHVVGVGSGTDALVLALRLSNIGSGDEVVTVSHSFVATATAIALVGATPVFVDLDDGTMLMDPEKLASSMSPRTKAVIPVHLNGYPCDMESIRQICREKGLALIEDCAQAIGATCRGRPVGSWGVGCFSLHPLKILSACGDAGFIAVEDDQYASRLRELRNLGLRDRDHARWISGNCRLDTLQAAILLAKLPILDEYIRLRRSHADAYRKELSPKLRLPPEDGERRGVCTAFVVRHPERDLLVQRLLELGVDVKVHYPIAIHQQEAFAYLPQRPLPVTEKVVSEIVSLPVSHELEAEDIRYVVDSVNRVVEEL